jgi:hypothetical protein
MRTLAASVGRAAVDELHHAARAGHAFDFERSAELPGQSADKAKPRRTLAGFPGIKSRSIILDLKQV